MEKIIELREKYDLHTTAERFIPDEGGIPCGDAEFLRKYPQIKENPFSKGNPAFKAGFIFVPGVLSVRIP